MAGAAGPTPRRRRRGNRPPTSEQGAPRAIFVLHHLRLRSGGLTKAWLRRIRLFADAGWDVHVALITPDLHLGRTLRVLRNDGRLPRSVVVHRYWRYPPAALSAVSRAVRRRSGSQVPGWLDRLATTRGALVFADSPAAYPYVASMRNRQAAKVLVIHLAHLSTAATRLATPALVANGPLTDRFADLPEGTLQAADRIVVLTEAQRDDFLQRWGSELPVEVIAHHAEAPGPPDSTDFDPRLVVVLGRLDYHKRWDDAIRAMARVLAEVPDARLMIYGQGDDLDRLKAVVQEVGLTASATFAGYTTSPLRVMAGAACVISTTRREAMPLTLLECLSVGTPVVVYDIRYGPREIVRDGVDGFVVPARDVRAAADAVVRLLTEPDLRQDMSTAARSVTARFGADKHDQAWLDLGRTVFENRGSNVDPGTSTGNTRSAD